MNYEIISIEKINEPYRGQNYSEFYFTTYITVRYNNNLDEITTFTFYEESEEEINNTIINYLK